MERSEGVLTLQMNRPEKKNALTLDMYRAMSAAIEESNNDPQTRVVLFKGVAGCFTSGNDLTDFMNPNADLQQVLIFLNAISKAKKPLMAAVDGFAIGVGTTLLLHCDLVYASDRAVFKLPFVDLGLVPEAGSTLILPMAMGHQRAAELLLFGDKFGAAKAQEVGIVNQTLPSEELEDFALERARTLARKAPSAVRATKELMKAPWATEINEVIHKEAAIFVERLRGPEAMEALQAFMQRRQPDFSPFD